jgi:hypothetical protein
MKYFGSFFIRYSQPVRTLEVVRPVSLIVQHSLFYSSIFLFMNGFLATFHSLQRMQTVLTIVRYPPRYIFFGLCAMIIFRFHFWIRRRYSFWKLFGCGRNGSFDVNPDWRQWVVLTVMNIEQGMRNWELGIGNWEFGSHSIRDEEEASTIAQGIIRQSGEEFTNSRTPMSYKRITKILYGSFITSWWKWFRCETYTLIMEPIEQRGSWDGIRPFGVSGKGHKETDRIAVLTRATIRFSKAKAFWRHVKPVVQELENARGLIATLGIGELPWIKQATFSIWKDLEAMETFAYQMREHREVSMKTRIEKWYSEELFVRFRLIAHFGKIKSVRFYL